MLALLTATSSAWAIGLLIPNNTEGGPLAIESHRVSIEIRDSAAVTHVDQVFRNSSGTQLEATFIFPLPADSTVSEFALWMNGVRVEGEVLERTQARQIYENIVRRVRDPGLVEYMDGRLFQANIFPVPANGTQRVELTFTQVLERQGDLQRLVYPMRTGRTAASTLEDFTLTAEINSTSPLRAVYSPTHNIDVDRQSDHLAVVGLEQDNADLERDFVLYTAASDKDVGVSVMSFDPDGSGGEDGYFLMVLSPRLEQPGELPPKDVTFVVDTSGSMAGEKMEQAQETLRYCVSQLRPQDRFNIVRFSTTARTLFDDLTPATEENVTRAQTFIGELRAAGGTAIEQALDRALAQTAQDGRTHMVIFVTDGLPTVGETDPQLILSGVDERNAANARIFSFGVGYDVDTRLLDSLATGNGAISDYVRPSEDIEVAVSTLYDRISYPILSDLEIDFGDVEVYDTYPQDLADLFAGHQVVVAGRYRNAGVTDVEISGLASGERVSMEYTRNFTDTTGDDPNDFIPQMWATRKIGFLVEQIRINGESRELRDEVMNLGVRYGLVTPYTSYLAVDDSEFGGPVPIAMPMPEEPMDDMVLRTMTEASGWGEGRRRAEEDEEREAAPAAPMGGDFDSTVSSGRDAVESSEEAHRMQETQIADRRTPVQQLGAYRLSLDPDGVWRDDFSREATDAQRIQVQYLSDAYFRLMELRGDITRLVGVGEKVAFQWANGIVIEIGDTGLETLDAETEAALVGAL
jgi:Ca-activated chloride channel family protein